MTKHHDLLGVSPGASEKELKQAYRELVKVWHPDRFSHDSALQKKAQEKLQEINQAFEELSKIPEASAAPSAGPAAYTPQAVVRSGSPWPMLIVIGIVVGPLAYLGVQTALNQRAISPKLFLQESGALADTGPRRYILNDPVKKEFYIIEGPRVPLDWEIDALVGAYTGHSPKTRQSVGNFTISQTVKPGDKDLTQLNYKAKEI